MSVVRSFALMLYSVLLGVAAGCAVTPDIHVDADPAADLKASRTFAFLRHASPEQVRFAAAMDQRLKEATRVALESRGYRYVDQSPDLWVHFYLNTVDLQPTPSQMPRPGTLNLDLIDANRRALVWHAVAEGRINERVRRDTGNALDNVVREIFLGFPEAERKL